MQLEKVFVNLIGIKDMRMSLSNLTHIYKAAILTAVTRIEISRFFYPCIKFTNKPQVDKSFLRVFP